MPKHKKAREKVTFFIFQKFISPIERFLRFEASGGVLLLISAFLALLLANSNASPSYFSFIHLPIGLHFGSYVIEKTLQHWINDGLMTIFFMVVGLEIKREICIGELSSLKKASLPIFAALGGMVIPALIYILFNGGQEGARGWGIPMATDIAFAIGLLSLMSRRVPFSLKVFLLALAIVDDLGAVLVIALFYTEEISLNALGMVSLTLALMCFLAFLNIRSFTPFIILGISLWFSFLKSGVHPTVAGVLLGFLPPLNKEPGETKPPLEKLLNDLHPVVTFLIMPIFAFTNAGVSLKDFSLFDLLSRPVPLGIFFGLVLGKPLGVFTFSYLAVRMKIATLPRNIKWFQILCMGIISGIGFTMAIFINNLAFLNSSLFSNEAKTSILLASIVSGILGLSLLFLTKNPHPFKEKK